MTDLKPCPFCGGEAKAKRHHNRYSDWWLVSCVKCGVSQTGNANEFEFEAAESWNNRIPQTVVNQHGANCTHISNCGTLNLNL